MKLDVGHIGIYYAVYVLVCVLEIIHENGKKKSKASFQKKINQINIFRGRLPIANSCVE